MKKFWISVMAAVLLLTVSVLPAMAVSVEQGALLPVDIVISGDGREIRKIYELSPETDPSPIPTEAFERDGMAYRCTDVLREVVTGTEILPYSCTETLESEKKDMDTLLALFPAEKLVTTDEGFTGKLLLDKDSIKTEPAASGSYTRTFTATRTYPNQAGEDTSFLPKTITENGRTLTLQNVSWQTESVRNDYDCEVGERYTATCTYGTTASFSYVKSYTVTADYTGELCRTGVSVIRYTAIFNGTPLVPEETQSAPETETEPAGEPQAQSPDKSAEEAGGKQSKSWPWVVAASVASMLSGVGVTYFAMRRKGAYTE